MARKKKPRVIKKVIIIAGALVLVQVGLIIYFQQSTPERSAKDEISAKLNATNLPTAQKDQMRIQLAVEDYRLKNGKLPKTLNELVPSYFDSVPVDPLTNQPFAYNIEGSRFSIGQKGGKVAVAAKDLLQNSDKLTPGQQDALIASLENPLSSAENFVYDSTGKRDPFRPFDFSVKNTADCVQFPLACYDINELRLVAVLAGMDKPTATVENKLGRGFLIYKGTKIGRNGGEVVEILSDRVKILESLTDVTGEVTNTVQELVLRSKAQQAAQSNNGTQTRKPR